MPKNTQVYYIQPDAEGVPPQLQGIICSSFGLAALKMDAKNSEFIARVQRQTAKSYTLAIKGAKRDKDHWLLKRNEAVALAFKMDAHARGLRAAIKAARACKPVGDTGMLQVYTA